MSEILFKSICFAENCNNKTVINWHHETCSSSSNEYLNENGYIRCSECGSIWPLLRTKFNCCTHSNINAISNTNFNKAIDVLYIAREEINQYFMSKLFWSLLKQHKKFH